MSIIIFFHKSFNFEHNRSFFFLNPSTLKIITSISAEIFGSDSFLDYTRLHVGAVLPRDALVPSVKNFDGDFQQLIFNGENYLDQIKNGRRTEYTMTGTFVASKHPDDALMLYHTLSFENQETYLGLSQFKGHYDINIFFQFRTTKPNG